MSIFKRRKKEKVPEWQEATVPLPTFRELVERVSDISLRSIGDYPLPLLVACDRCQAFIDFHHHDEHLRQCA